MGNCKGFCSQEGPNFSEDIITKKEIITNTINEEDLFSKRKINKEKKEESQERINKNYKNDKNNDKMEIILSKKNSSLISVKDQNSSDLSTYKEIKSKIITNCNKLVAETIGKTEIISLPPITLENDIVYTGSWANGMKNGKGIQVWKNQSKYEGEWLNDQFYGKGKFTNPNGDFYDGKWKEGIKNGFGIFFHFNGTKYVKYLTFFLYFQLNFDKKLIKIIDKK